MSAARGSMPSSPSERPSGAPSGASSGEGVAGTGSPRRPAPVLVTAVLVLLEGVYLLVATVLALASLGQPSVLTFAGRVALPIILAALGAWQINVGIKHLLGRAWTRAPIVAWQLFQIIVSVYYLANAPGYGDWLGFALGVALFVPAAVALVLVFSPSTRRWLEPDDRPRR